MKNRRTPGEVKKSILKGLDEAILMTYNISQITVSGKEQQEAKTKDKTQRKMSLRRNPKTTSV